MKTKGNKLQDDIERINQRMQELLQKLFEQVGTDFASFGGMKGQTGVDPYRVLGLDKSASDDEVKKRYRERVRQFHPDTAGPGMEFHLQAVLAAYELIRREREW